MSKAKGVVKDYRVATVYTQAWSELVSLPLIAADNTTLMKLDAEGSTYDPELIDNLTELGFKIINLGTKKAEHKYRAKFDDDGTVINTYDVRAIARGLRQADIQDMAVCSFVVLIDDPQIREVAETHSVELDRYWLWFKADPVDSGKDRTKLEGFPVNQRLIPPFQYRKLHLRKLIDQQQRTTQPKSALKWIIYWHGKALTGSRTPRKVAKYIAQTYLDRYGKLDVYMETKESTIQLIDIED